MNDFKKKSIALIICFTFITLAVVTSSAQEVQHNSNIEDPSEQITSTSNKVTLYRHGLDGSITPIEIDISIEDGQDIEEVLDDKCREILEADEEIQEQAQALSDLTFGAIVYIESRGKGFHYQAKLIEKLFLRFWLWKLVLPRVALFMARPIVFCRYDKDPEARTYFKTISPTKWISYYIPDNIEQFLWRQNRSVEIIGNHSVAVNSFIGITSWMGRFSFSPLNLRAHRFFGYGRFVVTNKLK
jgi:hypothetical protein